LNLASLNETLGIINTEILKNPFSDDFSTHEQIGVSSIVLRLMSLKDSGKSNCKISEIRPGCSFSPLLNDIIINIPDIFERLLLNDSRFERSIVASKGGGSMFGIKTHSTTSSSPTLLGVPGNFFLSATNQVGFDGGIVLTGSSSKTKKEFNILILSQAKAKIEALQKKPKSTSIITSNSVKIGVGKIKDLNIDFMLQLKDKPFVIFDYYSNRDSGVREIKLTDDPPTMVTTKKKHKGGNRGSFIYS